MAPMIKFRGIPLEDVSSIDGVNFDGKFVYGNYAKNGDGALIIGDVLEAEEDVFWPSWWVPVEPKTVGQFTGLKDVNGKEIYIGDIIKFFGANKKFKSKNEFGIIIYKADRYGAGFNSIIQNKEHGYGGINIAQDIVVGNVHENPELLEADK
ncbi:YopX family protein [Lactiplantibacillus plantarum]